MLRLFLIFLISLSCTSAQAVIVTDVDSTCYTPWKITYSDGNLTCNPDNSITVSDSGAGTGEANTASNTGTLGVGLFKQKAISDLEFYKIASANNRLTAALSGTDYFLLTFNEANVDHDALTNFTTTEHFIQSAIITVGTIGTGVWNGTPLIDAYISDTLTASLSTLAAADTNTTAIATTSFVQQEINGAGGTNLTCSGGVCNVDDSFLSNTGDVGTGVYDFGGATSIEIVNAAAPTVDAAGEIAVDTTTDQLVYYGVAKRTLPYYKEVCVTLETPVDADDNIMFYQPHKAITITDVVCRVDGGTSIPLTISDGTNALEAITCAATATEDDGSILNGTFTALERMEFDLGTPVGTNTWLNFCITYTVDAD